MINRLIFRKLSNIEIELQPNWLKIYRKEFDESVSDPFLGIHNWREINTRLFYYFDNYKFNLYFKQNFLIWNYPFKPAYPYFTGRISHLDNKIILTGRIGFNKITDFILPFIIIGLCFLRYLTGDNLIFILLLPFLFFLFQIPKSYKLGKELLTKLKLGEIKTLANISYTQ